MKFTVLMENTAPQGGPLTCEHGLSLLIEYRGHSILLDAGSSGAFADNAAALGEDLSKVEWAVLSHGHYDHADGLRRFFACNETSPVYVRPTAGGAYFSRSTGQPRFIGIHRDLWQGQRGRFLDVPGPLQFTPGAWLLPETVHGGPFASREVNLLCKVDRDQFVPDGFSHEQSLVLETGRGLAVFNSCSHGGIVNIVQSVQEQLPGKRVFAVVGGLHMYSASADSGLNCPPDYVRAVARALKELGVEQVYTGHCTGPAALALLGEALGPSLHALTTGLRVEL